MDEAIERRIGWLRQEPGGTLEINLLAPVSMATWDEFQELVGTQARLRPYLIDFLALESEFQAVIEAHVQFAEGIALSANPAFWPPSEQFIRLAQVQRHVSNFLGAASAFRDRMSARLTEDGNEALRDSILGHVSELYDQNFAYRLLYNLRNYAQHHDLPIDVTNLHIGNVSELERDVTVTFAIKADALLRSKRIQRKLRLELEAFSDPQIHLMGAAQTYFRCHVLIMKKWLAAQEETFRTMVEYRAAVEGKLNLPAGAVPLIFEGEIPNLSFRHFAFDELDLWASLAQRMLGEPPPPAT